MCPQKENRNRKPLKITLPEKLKEKLKKEKENISRYIQSLIEKDIQKVSESGFYDNKKQCGGRDSNPRTPARRDLESPQTFQKSLIKIKERDIKSVLNSLKIKNVTDSHYTKVKSVLYDFAESVDWKFNFDKVTDYLESKKHYSHSRYRFFVLYVRKLLMKMGLDWANDIDLPEVPEKRTPRISREMVREHLETFNDLGIEREYILRLVSSHLLSAVSGLRATEIYRLGWDQVDLENRIVKLRIGESAETTDIIKNRRERSVIFNEKAQESLEDYYEYSEDYDRPFAQKKINYYYREFGDRFDLRLKHMRKFFSQEWSRENGNEGIKKILMGHSTANDIDLRHYNIQSLEDLKEVYDKVGLKILE